MAARGTWRMPRRKGDGAVKMQMTIDYSPFLEGLSMMQTDRLKKDISKATFLLAQQIHRKTKSEYKATWPGGSHKNPNAYDGTIGDAIINGLTVRRVYNKYTGMANARISTWGNRKKGSRSYYLSFFEIGTQSRRTEKGLKRGKIKPLGIMNKQLEAADIENKMKATIEQHIQKILNKV